MLAPMDKSQKGGKNKVEQRQGRRKRDKKGEREGKVERDREKKRVRER